MKKGDTLGELQALFIKAKEVRDATNKPSVKRKWRHVARALERKIVALKRLTR